MLCVVFFFKQKTAYEMRISDWSSDVCSSDLIVRQRELQPPPHAIAGLAQHLVDAQRAGVEHQHTMRRIEPVQAQISAAGELLLVKVEIGRASRRERVCQYV